MMNIIRTSLACTLIIICCALVPLHAAMAQLKVTVTDAVVEPVPIAITMFYSETPAQNTIGQRMPEIIKSNLQRTGLFEAVNSNAFIQTVQSIHQDGPRFADWRAINAEALVTGTVTTTPQGETRVEFRLWDVFGERQLSGMAYTTTNENWRRITHIISDEIYKRLTGEDGYFDSRIVYIAESGPATSRIKRLAIMDQDGANHYYLTDGKDLVLTPRFSPNQQKIAYLAYYNNRPRVYIYDINTGKQNVLGDFPGMTFSPRFSPDGNRVIMSMSQNGNSDVYVMDLRTRRVSRLTTHSGIDTAPSYSPDGKYIVFESDRGGTQQLYVMKADGSDQQRITFGKGRYATPVWSPRGDLIAFTRLYNGQFYVGVVRPNGDGERLITSGYHVEGPTWSPNGRVLAYFKETKGTSRSSKTANLYTIDLTGYNERKIATPADASDPAWSPLNP